MKAEYDTLTDSVKLVLENEELEQIVGLAKNMEWRREEKKESTPKEEALEWFSANKTVRTYIGKMYGPFTRSEVLLCLYRGQLYQACASLSSRWKMKPTFVPYIGE